jgi:hypothetical protein
LVEITWTKRFLTRCKNLSDHYSRFLDSNTSRPEKLGRTNILTIFHLREHINKYGFSLKFFHDL